MTNRRQSFDQAVADLLADKKLNQRQRTILTDNLRRQAWRGELTLDPCEGCNGTHFDYDDGCLFCGHCGLEYGAEPP